MTVQPKQLDASFSVCEQIDLIDVEEAALAGYRSIICNRPDGEGMQTPFAEIEKVAVRSGMKAAYLPITPGQMTMVDITQFLDLLDTLPKPILAYCRSGARASGLWTAAGAVRRTS